MTNWWSAGSRYADAFGGLDLESHDSQSVVTATRPSALIFAGELYVEIRQRSSLLHDGLAPCAETGRADTHLREEGDWRKT